MDEEDFWDEDTCLAYPTVEFVFRTVWDTNFSIAPGEKNHEIRGVREPPPR